MKYRQFYTAFFVHNHNPEDPSANISENIVYLYIIL